MVKKIKKDSISIKSLLNKGLKLIQVTNLLGISRQKVNYWKKDSNPEKKVRCSFYSKNSSTHRK